MKKYILLTLLFLHVFVGYSQKSDINKTKPFSLEISVTKKSNQSNSFLVDYAVINNKKYPRIIKLGCVATYKMTSYGIAFRILHNGKRFYDAILNKCGINKCFLFRKKHFGSYEINFEYIYGDGEYKRHLKNNTYGLYSIQAIWYLPKDTIYSNIIELEYQKEK